MDLYILVYLLSNVFLAHIINKFMYLFYEKCRVNKYIEFCVYSAYFILITFVFLYFGNAVVTVGFNIVYIFLFTLMYDYVDFKKNILVTFIVYLVLCSIEVSVVAIISLNNINIGEYQNIIGFLINSIIYIFISFFIYIKNVNFKKINLIFSNRHFIFFGIIPVVSTILIIINFLLVNSIFFIIILNLGILFFNVVIFKYCDLIIKKSYKKFFDKLLDDRLRNHKKEILIFQNSVDFKKYVNSKNYTIDEVINSKINNVNDQVKLTFDISIDKDLKVSLNDLLVVIGNLMDNAILGVKSTLKNKDKYIDIKIKYIKGTVIVNIKNSFNENTLNKNNRLFSKKGRFNSYGLGLLSVKEIVEKYKGVLEVKFNRNNFETYVLLYDIKV